LTWSLIVIDIDVVNFTVLARVGVLLVELLLLSCSSEWNLMWELVLVV
jgi:hypothetical protein